MNTSSGQNDEKTGSDPCSVESDRKQADEAMLNLVNGIDVAIYATVPDTGELVFVNEYMRKMFGIEDLDITGMYCYKIFRQGFDV